MCPELIHLYGPVAIRSYGLMIVAGFLLFLYTSYYDDLRVRSISGELYLNTVFMGLLGGVLGGRLLYVFMEWRSVSSNLIEMLFPWIGGFVVLGSILGALVTVSFYLKYYRQPIVPVFDVAATYAPLMQAIARIGCLCAGCCYGSWATKSLPWAIMFTNPEGFGPLHILLHPSQVYASVGSAFIFILLIAMRYRMEYVPGCLAFSYLFLDSFARFMVDFWRGDRGVLYSFFGKIYLSEVQLYAAFFGFGSLIGLFWVCIKNRR